MAVLDAARQGKAFTPVTENPVAERVEFTLHTFESLSEPIDAYWHGGNRAYFASIGFAGIDCLLVVPELQEDPHIVAFEQIDRETFVIRLNSAERPSSFDKDTANYLHQIFTAIKRTPPTDLVGADAFRDIVDELSTSAEDLNYSF